VHLDLQLLARPKACALRHLVARQHADFGIWELDVEAISRGALDCALDNSADLLAFAVSAALAAA